MKLFSTMLAGLAIMAMASCAMLNDGAAKLGLDVEFHDVYAEATAIEDRVYLTAGLYNASLVVLTKQCTGADPEGYTQAACERAASTATKLSPIVADLLETTGDLTEDKQDLLDAKAAVIDSIQVNGLASDETVAAVSKASAAVAETTKDLVLAYANVRKDLDNFIRSPG